MVSRKGRVYHFLRICVPFCVHTVPNYYLFLDSVISMLTTLDRLSLVKVSRSGELLLLSYREC